MIGSVNVISSAEISDDEFRCFLRDFGNGMGLSNLEINKKIYDGLSNVWIRQSELSKDEYEEEDVRYIEGLLANAAKSVIALEYDDGETAFDLVLRIVGQLSAKYPIVLDNGYGRIYRADEIQDLVSKGTG
jgi:hypothetical protein